MDMKNTVILLILLLSILGLIIGVHYTADDTSDVSQNSDKISLESDSQPIIIQLQNPGNQPNLINRIINLN